MYKKYFYLLILFTFQTNLYAQLEERKIILSTNDSVILSTLSKIHFRKYTNKPLGSLVKGLMLLDSVEYDFNSEPPCVLQSIDYSFGIKQTRVALVVVLKDLKYQDQFQENCNWDYQKLQKEIVSEIYIELDDFYYPWYSTKFGACLLKRKNVIYKKDAY